RTATQDRNRHREWSDQPQTLWYQYARLGATRCVGFLQPQESSFIPQCRDGALAAHEVSGCRASWARTCDEIFFEPSDFGWPLDSFNNFTFAIAMIRENGYISFQ